MPTKEATAKATDKERPTVAALPAPTRQEKDSVALKPAAVKPQEPLLPKPAELVKAPTTVGYLPLDSMFAQQIEDYDRLIKLNGGDRDAYYDRGIALLSSGQYVRAASDFEHYVTLSPKNAASATQARIFLSAAWLLGHARDKATSVLSQSIAHATSNTWPTPVFQFLIGQIAEGDLLAAVPGNSELTTAHYCAAVASLASGQTATALTHLKWVAANGDKRMDEYFLAMSAQQHLDAARKSQTKSRNKSRS